MLQADVYSRCNLGLSRIRAYAVWRAPGVRRVLARIRRAPGGVRRAYHPRRVGLDARSVADAPGRRRGAEAPRAVHCVSWTSVRDFAGRRDRRAAGPERGARDGGSPAPRVRSLRRPSARAISSVRRRRGGFARDTTGPCAIASEERASASDLARSRICKASSASAPPVAEVGCVRPSAGTAVSAAPCRRARPVPWHPVCLRERSASRARRGHGPPAASSGWQP